MQAHRAAVRRSQHLQTALESRAVIEQATGILMARHEVSADRAFRMMATVSMDSDVEVREVAERVATDGGIGPPRGGR